MSPGVGVTECRELKSKMAAIHMNRLMTTDSEGILEGSCKDILFVCLFVKSTKHIYIKTYEPQSITRIRLILFDIQACVKNSFIIV